MFGFVAVSYWFSAVKISETDFELVKVVLFKQYYISFVTLPKVLFCKSPFSFGFENFST